MGFRLLYCTCLPKNLSIEGVWIVGSGSGSGSAFSKALSHPDPFAMPFTAVTITIGPLEKSAIGVWS